MLFQWETTRSYSIYWNYLLNNSDNSQTYTLDCYICLTVTQYIVVYLTGIQASKTCCKLRCCMRIDDTDYISRNTCKIFILLIMRCAIVVSSVSKVLMVSSYIILFVVRNYCLINITWKERIIFLISAVYLQWI